MDPGRRTAADNHPPVGRDAATRRLAPLTCQRGPLAHATAAQLDRLLRADACPPNTAVVDERAPPLNAGTATAEGTP